MRSEVLKGTGVALATPMHKDYTVDEGALNQLVNHVIDGGVDYLVVLGTTGESPVLAWKEKLAILELVLKANKGRKPIVFGLGGNHTYDLIEKSHDLKDFPIHAILSASPYYNKPSQEGIIRHYQLLADAFPHPIILYNVPARTASNMEADTTLELAKHPNIIAMKEASGDMDQCRQIEKNRPEGFLLLSGDDLHTHDLIRLGADGVISVVANLIPDRFTEMVRVARSGNWSLATKLDKDLQEAYALSVQEGNPSSIKAGLEVIGIGKRTVKPPLFDASDAMLDAWRKLIY